MTSSATSARPSASRHDRKLGKFDVFFSKGLLLHTPQALVFCLCEVLLEATAEQMELHRYTGQPVILSFGLVSSQGGLAEGFKNARSTHGLNEIN
jgi:hypothetical protein